eukprot:m.310090 g.310090  ORF g.310090 m.310090 type:complete len:447 (+) comp15948_c0_seq9:912-2252(+)
MASPSKRVLKNLETASLESNDFFTPTQSARERRKLQMAMRQFGGEALSEGEEGSEREEEGKGMDRKDHGRKPSPKRSARCHVDGAATKNARKELKGHHPSLRTQLQRSQFVQGVERLAQGTLSKDTVDSGRGDNNDGNESHEDGSDGDVGLDEGAHDDSLPPSQAAESEAKAAKLFAVLQRKKQMRSVIVTSDTGEELGDNSQDEEVGTSSEQNATSTPGQGQEQGHRSTHLGDKPAHKPDTARNELRGIDSSYAMKDTYWSSQKHLPIAALPRLTLFPKSPTASEPIPVCPNVEVSSVSPLLLTATGGILAQAAQPITQPRLARMANLTCIPPTEFAIARRITDMTQRDGIRLYRVQWAGPNVADTWEPAECLPMVQSFHSHFRLGLALQEGKYICQVWMAVHHRVSFSHLFSCFLVCSRTSLLWISPLPYVRVSHNNLLHLVCL